MTKGTKGEILFKEYGFTVDNIVSAAKESIKKTNV
jgi:transketolase